MGKRLERFGEVSIIGVEIGRIIGINGVEMGKNKGALRKS